MSGLLDDLDGAERSRIREATQPEWTSRMLATLVHDAFSGPDWIYERKLDGVCLLAFRGDGAVPLVSRNRKERNATWATPKLVCEVGFTEWTGEGKLRHPRFLGLRDDEKAEDVVRERPWTRPEEAG